MRVIQFLKTSPISKFAAVFVTALCVLPARPAIASNVSYVGGTALQGTGLHGKGLVSSTETLVFDGPGKISIPYERIMNYESKPHKEVHVWLLTEGLWRLIAPWPEGKQLSVSYADAEEHAQVVVLQMSRADEALLVEILKNRVPRGGYRAMPTPQPVALAQRKTADR